MNLTHYVLNNSVISFFIVSCFISHNCVENVVFSSFTGKKQEFQRSLLKHSLLNTISYPPDNNLPYEIPLDIYPPLKKSLMDIKLLI